MYLKPQPEALQAQRFRHTVLTFRNTGLGVARFEVNSFIRDMKGEGVCKKIMKNGIAFNLSHGSVKCIHR